MTLYPKEYVLTVKTDEFRRIGYFQGISFDIDKYCALIESPQYHHFKERNLVETDESYKQLIPYAILSYQQSLFVYRRGKLQGEKRLVGNYSCGVGGHISIDDPTLFGTTYSEGLLRELNEEIIIETDYEQQLVALINDDSNDVGKVHIGIVHHLRLKKPEVKPREKSMMDPQFLSIEQALQKIDEFETWSQICLKNIGQIVRNKKS